MYVRTKTTGRSAIPKEDKRPAFMITIRTKNVVMPAPKPPTRYQNRLPSSPQVRPLESEAELVSVSRRSVFISFRAPIDRGFPVLEVADSNGGIGIQAEDFEEGKDDRRRSR